MSWAKPGARASTMTTSIILFITHFRMVVLMREKGDELEHVRLDVREEVCWW